MALPIIFCPQCASLILDAEQCPTCHWSRPVASGDVGKPVWAVALAAKLPGKESHPVAAGGVVYFSTESGEIVALDTLEAQTEQAIKWRHKIDSRHRNHGVAVWNEFVLLGHEFVGGFPKPPGELILLNVKNGEEVWRHQVKGASLSVPVVHENTAYFTTNSGLYSINLETRQENWRHEMSSPWSWAPSAPLHTPDGLLMLPARSDHLIAFDIEKRETAWTFSGGGWFPHTPVWMDGMVYVRCWDSHIYALDGTTGREIWRYKSPRDFSSDICVSETYLYVGVKDYQGGAEAGSRAYALAVFDRTTGERIGRHEIPGHIFGRPAATEHAVFFATDDKSRVIPSQGTLYALDAQSQELLWEPHVVEQRFQSDLVLVGDHIIAGTRPGAVYAVPWRVEEAITEAPQVYAEQNQWEKAAIAYALQEDYAEAAQIYAGQLEQPLQAGQLYLKAGQNQQVVELLGMSTQESHRALALQAVQAMPTVEERAQALTDMGEYLGAANLYMKSGLFEKAGDGYLHAQAWQEAQDAYAKAEAWGKWEKVAREQELWQDLVDRYVGVGDYAQAAEVQLGRGYFLEAATYFDQAGMDAEALAAYRRVAADDLTGPAQQRMLELAEKTGDLELAFNLYKAEGKLDKAAELAEANGYYNQALELYRELGEYRKAGEMLEKQSRYLEAADMYEKARRWGQAAGNLEKQVEQDIERVGGIRYLQDTDQLETWLNQAIEWYEEEADYAGETTRRDLYEAADRCRVSLMRVRREPLLRLSLQADRLVYNQGNKIHYLVENVGWGTARNLTLSISGTNLLGEERYDLGSLGRRQKTEGDATVVPTLVGEIMLQVALEGQSKGGQLRESLTQPMVVVQMAGAGGPGVSLNTQVGYGAEGLRNLEAPVADRGSLWSDAGASSSMGDAPISPEQLKQQRIESLRRQLVKHYSNLNLLEEQAANYPAGQAPLNIQNDINNTQEKIDEIEETLEALEE